MQGELPNFSRLAEARGSYRRLRTTFPSVSPVAWSSFSTGSHPARHNIFDFLDRDRRTYLPRLSSTRVGESSASSGSAGGAAARQPELRLLRKSKPFWTILGEHRIWSTILRVPMTFPPDRFYGAQLSAMCVPDLLGTQGTFFVLTTRPAGEALHRRRHAHSLGAPAVDATDIEGPENLFVAGNPPLTLAIKIATRPRRDARDHHDRRCRRDDARARARLSDWLKLTFRAPRRASTSRRLLASGARDGRSLLALHVADQSRSGAAGDADFPPVVLRDLSREAHRPVRDARPGRRHVGAQRRRHERGHVSSSRRTTSIASAARCSSPRWIGCAADRSCASSTRPIASSTCSGGISTRGIRPPGDAARITNAIQDLYKKNDALVGRDRRATGADDLLMVISDHGFSSFRRGVNLNAWLQREGYLTLKPGADGRRAEWLRDVDWSATRAHIASDSPALFLNIRGREQFGIVAPGAEAEALKAEIDREAERAGRPREGEIGIREAFDTATLYSGPYLENGPDLLIGYNAGYRVSWDCASGVVAGPVFADNAKPWSGDHCIDPRLVPGVFFLQPADRGR